VDADEALYDGEASSTVEVALFSEERLYVKEYGEVCYKPHSLV